MISEEEAGPYCPQCRREWTVQKSPFSNNKFIHCLNCKESAKRILKKSSLKKKVAESFHTDEYESMLKQYELFLDGWDDDIFYVIHHTGSRPCKYSYKKYRGKMTYLIKGITFIDNKNFYTIQEDGWYGIYRCDNTGMGLWRDR